MKFSRPGVHGVLKLVCLRNIDTQKDKLKDTVIWNIEQGLSLTGPQLARVEVKRTQLFHRIREFMEKYRVFDFACQPGFYRSMSKSPTRTRSMVKKC
jgi:hypothetical protein